MICKGSSSNLGERIIKRMLNITTPQQSLPTPTTSRVPIPPNPKSPRGISRITNMNSPRDSSRRSPAINKDGTDPMVPLLETELGGFITKGEMEGKTTSKGAATQRVPMKEGTLQWLIWKQTGSVNTKQQSMNPNSRQETARCQERVALEIKIPRINMQPHITPKSDQDITRACKGDQQIVRS